MDDGAPWGVTGTPLRRPLGIDPGKGAGRKQYYDNARQAESARSGTAAAQAPTARRRSRDSSQTAIVMFTMFQVMPLTSAAA